MRLVKIDGTYFNPDKVDTVTRQYIKGVATGNTLIYVGGSEDPYTVDGDIEEVVKALTEDEGYVPYVRYEDMVTAVNKAQTIIEADTAESEE